MALSFVPLVDSQTAASHAAALFLRDILARHLTHGERVLWLVPGGSGMAVAQSAARLIAEQKIPCQSLTVTLTDECYGPPAHLHANEKVLSLIGEVLPDAKIIPVLSGAPLTKTAAAFSRALEEVLQTVDYRLGLVGIGADGHTAGIMPHSTAVESTELVVGYDAPPFTRITLTPRALARLDEIVAYAQGKEKFKALAELKANHSIDDQPAQVLKKVPRAYILSDYKDI